MKDHFTKEQLLSFNRKHHKKVVSKYLRGAYDTKLKRKLLFSWINPKKSDFILECGSSSGITCFYLSKSSGCRTLGIDFDPVAIKVSAKMRDKYFPELKNSCHFKKGNLEKMKFPHKVTKVIMPDFTEHITDKTFSKILGNIKKQFPHILLYIYTPSRSHIFEIMKNHNFILKKSEGHINVKTEAELKMFLKSNGWDIIECKWGVSYVPFFNKLEILLGNLPFFGKLFRRRISIIALPQNSKE